MGVDGTVITLMHVTPRPLSHMLLRIRLIQRVMEDKTLLNFLNLLFVDRNLIRHEMSKPRASQSKLLTLPYMAYKIVNKFLMINDFFMRNDPGHKDSPYRYPKRRRTL